MNRGRTSSGEDGVQMGAEVVDPDAARRARPEDVTVVEVTRACDLLSAPLALRRSDLVRLRGDDDVGDLLRADPVEHLLIDRRRADLAVDEDDEQSERVAPRQVALDHRLPLRPLASRYL